MLVTAPWFANTHVENCMNGVIIWLEWIALFVLALLLLVLELCDVVVVNDASWVVAAVGSWMPYGASSPCNAKPAGNDFEENVL